MSDTESKSWGSSPFTLQSHRFIPCFAFFCNSKMLLLPSVLVSNLYEHIILTVSFHKNIKETEEISDLPKAKQSTWGGVRHSTQFSRLICLTAFPIFHHFSAPCQSLYSCLRHGGFYNPVFLTTVWKLCKRKMLLIVSVQRWGRF